MVRYNSGIQRSKGFLEMGAALYEGSLSRKVTRSGTDVPQVNCRLGARLSLRIDPKPDRQPNEDDSMGVTFSVSSGLRKAVLRVVAGEISVLWVNPTVVLTLAYLGLPPFDAPQPVRTIAVFPSHDVIGFAVHESTGITAFEQILQRKYPLRLSTRIPITPPFDEDPTMFSVTSMMGAAGFSLDHISSWGGEIHSASRPSDSLRGTAIKAGRIDAIFDEGILSWGQLAIEHGFRILPIEGALRQKVEAAGYAMTTIGPDRLPGLREAVAVADFSGWPMIVHADMDEDLAYALCEAIESRQAVMPTDNYRPLNMADLCAGGIEAPRHAPLHPGAERFYRQRGYLKS
jgi:uncharacterized protein